MGDIIMELTNNDVAMELKNKIETKSEMIDFLKKEYSTLRIGNDDEGYTELNLTDYELQIEAWADNWFAEKAKAAEAAEAATDKAALLAKLGITADEAKLLLS